MAIFYVDCREAHVMKPGGNGISVPVSTRMSEDPAVVCLRHLIRMRIWLPDLQKMEYNGKNISVRKRQYKITAKITDE